MSHLAAYMLTQRWLALKLLVINKLIVCLQVTGEAIQSKDGTQYANENTLTISVMRKLSIKEYQDED